MFFGLTFKFKAILDEFDFQDGLRKLHNVVRYIVLFYLFVFPVCLVQFRSGCVFFISKKQQAKHLFSMISNMFFHSESNHYSSQFQISTLSILMPESDTDLNEDQECSARQVVRHVCVAYRRYLEAHLNSKYEIITRGQMRSNSQNVSPVQPSYKVILFLYECISTQQILLSFEFYVNLKNVENCSDPSVSDT